MKVYIHHCWSTVEAPNLRELLWLYHLSYLPPHSTNSALRPQFGCHLFRSPHPQPPGKTDLNGTSTTHLPLFDMHPQNCLFNDCSPTKLKSPWKLWVDPIHACIPEPSTVASSISNCQCLLANADQAVTADRHFNLFEMETCVINSGAKKRNRVLWANVHRTVTHCVIAESSGRINAKLKPLKLSALRAVIKPLGNTRELKGCSSIFPGLDITHELATDRAFYLPSRCRRKLAGDGKSPGSGKLSLECTQQIKAAVCEPGGCLQSVCGV